MFKIEDDPYVKNNLAEQYPEVVDELEKLLADYAKQQKPSEWLKAQSGFLGVQGKRILDPSFDISDGGLPKEKPVFPKK